MDLPSLLMIGVVILLILFAKAVQNGNEEQKACATPLQKVQDRLDSIEKEIRDIKTSLKG